MATPRLFDEQVEDDMDMSSDFFEYFLSAHRLLERVCRAAGQARDGELSQRTLRARSEI